MKKQMAQIQRIMNDTKNSSNKYNKIVYESKKGETEKLLSQLQSYGTSQTASSSTP